MSFLTVIKLRRHGRARRPQGLSNGDCRDAWAWPLPMPAMRVWVCALVLGVFSLGAAAQADFDRAKQGQRYRAWLAQFENDVRHYRSEIAKGGAQTDEEVARIFAHSVVPGSRAITNVREVFGSGGPDYSRGGEIVFVGPAPVVLQTLRVSVPAGAGGTFPESKESRFPRDLSVWYMHIDSSEDSQSRYFESREVFDPYHLPPTGKLERHAYPFLLFEDRGDALRFGGFSAEYWGLVQYLLQLQYM